MDSPTYSYLLNHNVEKIDPVMQHQALSMISEDSSEREIVEQAMSVQNIIMIKTKEHLVE